jgi:hypothetical protein
MALLTTQKLFIDIETGSAYRGWNDFSSVPTPTFYEDDTAKLELYLVRRTTSAAFPMESVAFPTSTISVSIGTPGSAAAAEGTTWSSISTPSASWSSPTLTVPVAEANGGSFTLTLTNGSPSLTATTAALTYLATAGEISAAIVSAVNAQSGWSAASATVTQTGAGKFNISVKATNSTTVYTLTVAVTSSLTGPSGYAGEVAFTAAAIDTLLGANAQVTSTLEVQCTDSTKVQTYLQTACIVRKVVDAIA